MLEMREVYHGDEIKLVSLDSSYDLLTKKVNAEVNLNNLANILGVDSRRILYISPYNKEGKDFLDKNLYVKFKNISVSVADIIEQSKSNFVGDTFFKYKFNGRDYPVVPKDAFFTWIYLKGIASNSSLVKSISEKKYFLSDKKQDELIDLAKICNLAKTYLNGEQLKKVVQDFDYFFDLEYPKTTSIMGLSLL